MNIAKIGINNIMNSKPTVSESWYAGMGCNPVNKVDLDGQLPILVNGLVSDDSERGIYSYWDSQILNIISEKTYYPIYNFWFVDGDQGNWAGTRGCVQNSV